MKPGIVKIRRFFNLTFIPNGWFLTSMIKIIKNIRKYAVPSSFVNVAKPANKEEINKNETHRVRFQKSSSIITIHV
jgi:hypothetical protein